MTNTPPLTLLEELLLLALDEKTGDFYPVDTIALHRAAASTLLMDLSLRNRIDYDLRDMFVVDPTPTGDELLDPVIKLMAQAPVLTPHSAIYWLGKLSDEGADIIKKGLARLEKRGIISRPCVGMFWMFGFGSRPVVDAQKIGEVRAALMESIQPDKIPSPHNVLLTGLAEGCGLFRYILGEAAAKNAGPRIAEVAHMDLIHQAARSIANGEPAASSGR
ncbi:MAG: GPP34 family phosphoprotein [Alphaproteobacteria bacterium]|nr:GPP34 family phosphoprotein [Alphaproteobacteria bacterium]